MVVWLGVFTVGSIFISNPFAAKAAAEAQLDYRHVMYLHGLLIGLVGLAALLACEVFGLKSRHVRLWIVAGVVVATTLAGIGGSFNLRIPGAEVAMGIQVGGFFTLDEILIVLLWGLFRERPRRPLRAALPFWTAWIAAAAMFGATLMGHLAGWTQEFGDPPSVVASYARWIGVRPADFLANVISSHGHVMAVASMGLISVLAVEQFGLSRITGRSRAVTLAALGLMSFGLVLIPVVYMTMAFSTWAPPTLFQSAGGLSGIPADDLLTGLTVMLGGLVALVMTAYGRRRDMASWLSLPLHLAAVIAWAGSFITVAVVGYAIEMNEKYFGAGGPAKGAANDAVFTWLHQDVGLFLLPGVVLFTVAAHRLITVAHQVLVGWFTAAGALVILVGAMIFVFVNPDLHGRGYLESASGMLLVTAGVAVACYRMITDAPAGRRDR